MPDIVPLKAESRKAPSTPDPQPAQPLTEFQFFKSLPPELRFIIWKYAMETTRRILRISAQEVETLPAHHNLPPGIPRPSASGLMSNGVWLFPSAVIEGLHPEHSPLPHQLLFVCKESHCLALEKNKLRWEYTPPISKRLWYNYIPQPNETWEPPKDRDVGPFHEIRRHFLAEEKAPQRRETTLMDLENDIVYLVPEMGAYYELARFDIMVRWFPFLPNIRYLCVTLKSFLTMLKYEQLKPETPRHLPRFTGLKHLIVTLEDRDAYYKDKRRLKAPRLITEANFERLEKEVPGWKRPRLGIILDKKELQEI